MQPVQVNLRGAGDTQAYSPNLGPNMQPMYNEPVDLANESSLSLGDLGRAASNLWGLFKKSMPWLLGAFGVYKIWESFSNRQPATSPEEAAAMRTTRPSSTREPLSPSGESSGPIEGLRKAATSVVGAAASAIHDPEKRKPSEPFPLRLLKTLTRFAGPGAGMALGLEEAAPDVIQGSQLMARGDFIQAGGAYARAFVKTAATMAVAHAGEKAGEWALGWLPAGKPVGRWLGWVLGSALGERLGNGAVAAMGRIAASLGAEASSAERSPEAAGAKRPEPARRRPVAPPDIGTNGLTAANRASSAGFVARSFDLGPQR
ncbi:MAG: hypothetical protein PHO89_10465 [Methylacidiphilaceae bacterium]|nr:hypothetical protein [Candidatus Methylacidiphilaceae bacterium]